MRILVVSDIHANWPALAAIDEPHDFCVCLGDLVDYGPDPLACVRWAMEHARYAIRGNHDHGAAQGIAVAGESGYRYLTRVTRPLVWESLGPEERRYLLQLPLTSRFTVERPAVPAGPRDAPRPARRIPDEGPGDLGQAAPRLPTPTSSASATRTCSSTSGPARPWSSTRGASATRATATPARPTP